MGLLLTAVFVSCNAGAPSERDKLTAQKEHLINKLSDNISKLVPLTKSSASTENLEDVDTEETSAAIVKMGLMGLCGALESRNETIAKVLAEWGQQPQSHPQLLPIIQQCIDAREISRKCFFSLLAELEEEDMDREPEGEALAELDIVLGDITALLKVVKQLRELT